MREIRLLLVEDDEDDYFLTSECLAEVQHRKILVDWVLTYEEGLSRLREGQYDICFLDYRIGGRTGIEILEVVKAEQIFTPVVLLTGVGQRDIDLAATEAGASDFLDKDDLRPALAERTIRYSMANAQAKRELAESSALLKATLANAAAGIAGFDSSGCLASYNEIFEEFIARLSPNMGTEDLQITALIEACGTDQGTVHCSDGRAYDIQINSTPYGEHVLVAMDITERQELQENLRLAKSNAEAASRAKSAFFSIVSHELRTPIHNVIGFAEVLMEGKKSDISEQECAEFIHDGGRKLLNIVNSLLEFSRLESGQEFMHTPLYDLDFVLVSIVQAVTEQFADKDVTCSVDIDPEIAGVVFEEAPLRSFIHRALENAVYYSHSGGEVRLGIERLDQGATVFIEDDGVGMAPAFVDEILAPFSQLDDGLNRSFEGIGLGLSIVKHIAEIGGAELKIQSEENKGTRVDFILPEERIIVNNFQKQNAVCG